MKIEVDAGLCQGHGECQAAAPEVFEVRDDNLAHVLLPETHDPTIMERARAAQRRCPTDAIVITEDD